MNLVKDGRLKPCNKQKLEWLRIPGQGYRLDWVRSHPEKTQPIRALWTPDQVGIDRADAVAEIDWSRYMIDN